MAKVILITQAFEDGNKKLFSQSKPTYKSVYFLCQEIGKELGCNSRSLFYRTKYWENGFNKLRGNSEEVLDLMFNKLELNKEDYILEIEKKHHE